MPASTPQNSYPPRRRLLLTGALLAVAALVALLLQTRPADLEKLRSRAEQQLRQRNYSAALEITSQILRQLPNDPESLWIASRSELALKRPRQAAELLLAIPPESSRALPAALEAAELLHQRLALLSPAEVAWRKVLQLDPDHPAALAALAQLLAFSGRRDEAVPNILRLVQIGQPSDLLIALARPSAAVHDEQLLQLAAAADPLDPNLLLAKARLAEQNGQLAESTELCRTVLRSAPDYIPAQVQLGRTLLQINEVDQLLRWERELPAALQSRPEFYRVRALSRLLNGQTREALPLLILAARRHPDQRDVLWQLARLLRLAGDPQAAERCERFLEKDRVLQEAQDVVLFSQESMPADAVALVNACLNCGRLIEAAGWAELARRRFPQSAEIGALASDLAEKAKTAPLQLVQDSANPALKISDQHPLQDQLSSESRPQTSGPDLAQPRRAPRSSIAFTPLSPKQGFDFTFINGAPGPPSRRMFELTGGGVAAADLDLDGWTDLLCTQGGTWGNGRKISAEPVLEIFRNLRGKRFSHSTRPAAITAADFGQGLAVGDFNQDGFPDVLTASTQGARLFINLGDGSFQDLGTLPQSAGKWITSCAIADLDSDSFPDLFLVAYLGGADVFDRLCDDGTGQPAMCLPAVFPAVPDLLLVNDASGSFMDHSSSLPPSNAEGKGLGVLVIPPQLPDPDARPQILIANDTTPNALLSWDPRDRQWLDQGFASGLAVSSLGRAEGSMGIAAADLNADQIPELVITNFLGESHAWYESQPGATWLDLRRPAGLEAATRDVLGFGCCFLDAQLDGTPELFIANGHIDNLEHLGRPWKMPSQLFDVSPGGCTLIPADQLGPWFITPHIARAAATLDWNRDHAPDLLVGLLHESSTLLTNTTPALGNAISIKLIATSGERSAVGASSIALNVDQSPLGIAQQIVAGHGYQAASENTLIHPCNSLNTLPTLRVTWPATHTAMSADNFTPGDPTTSSPSTQTFRNLATNQHYIILQNRPEPYLVPL